MQASSDNVQEVIQNTVDETGVCVCCEPKLNCNTKLLQMNCADNTAVTWDQKTSCSMHYHIRFPVTKIRD